MQSDQKNTASERSSQAWLGAFQRLIGTKEMGVLLALVVLMIGMSFLSPYFFTSQNIFNVLRSIATIGIMSIGMTMIIVTGGIDLSVGEYGSRVSGGGLKAKLAARVQATNTTTRCHRLQARPSRFEGRYQHRCGVVAGAYEAEYSLWLVIATRFVVADS